VPNRTARNSAFSFETRLFIKVPLPALLPILFRCIDRFSED